MKIKRNLISLIVLYVFALLSLVFVLIIHLVNKQQDLTIALIILLILALGAIAFGSISLYKYIHAVYINKGLEKENSYFLGRRFSFCNMNAFIERVSNARRNSSLYKSEQYAIAFTASKKNLVKNDQRNESVVELNGKVAELIISLFMKEGSILKNRKHYFGFDKGVFYIYCFKETEAGVRDLVAKIKDEITNVSLEDNIRVFVEPLFGIKKINNQVSISENLDDAALARSLAETRFETYVIYSDSFRKVASQEEVKEILEALENEEFVVYYQAKYNLNLKQFTSSEALVRWNSKKHGLLPPSKFIPTAEIAGLIHEIDTFVFKKVCEDLNEAKRKGRRILPVSVNFSLYEFFSSKFLDVILELLDSYKIDPQLIQIEITEGTSQANQFLSVSIIKKLQEKGIKILMDDFGVGFSNIGNLRNIPWDVIKLDKGLIDNITVDPKSAQIVKFLIQLCKANGMEVVAEGVDDAEQVEMLKKFRCDTIQGYYFSKPLPKSDYEKLLKDNQFETRDKDGNLR